MDAKIAMKTRQKAYFENPLYGVGGGKAPCPPPGSAHANNGDVLQQGT